MTSLYVFAINQRPQITLATVLGYLLLGFWLIVFLGGPALAQDSEAPVSFSADNLETNHETGVFIARGNVSFSQGTLSLTAERVDYNRVEESAVATGNVVFIDHDGSVHYAERIELDTAFTRAFAEPVISKLADGSWLTGDRVRYEKDSLLEYDNARYTPCQCDYLGGEKPIWEIESSSSHHNPETRTVEHKDVRFRLFNVPILYLPWLKHPDWTVRRQSGLLYPSFKYSSDHGFEYAQSYYHVVDDTSDVEIRPHLYQSSGQLTEFRYRKLWDQSTLDAKLYLGRVSSFEKNREVVSEVVSGVDADFKTLLGERWHTKVKLYRASQDTFLRRYDLDSNTTLKSLVSAENINRNRYSKVEAYDIQGLESDEVSGNEPVVLPSVFHERYLPSFRDNMRTRLRLSAIKLENDENYDINRWAGEVYTIEDFEVGMGNLSVETRFAGQYHMIVDTPSSSDYRGELGQASGGLGVGWSNPFSVNLFNKFALVEPKIKLAAIEAIDRTDKIPNRDSADFRLDEGNLFMLHRFQGNDYIRSGAYLAGGVNTIVEDTAVGDVTGFIGASYRLSGDVSTNLNTATDEDHFSDILASVTIQPQDYFSLALSGRFDSNDLSISESRATGTVYFGDTYFAGSYSRLTDSFFASADEEEETLTFNLNHRLTDDLALTVKQQYDLTDTHTEIDDETSIAMRFTGGLQDCLTITLKYTRDNTSDRDIRPAEEILLLLDFKYLGSITSDQISSFGQAQ